jgi:type II secretion system protein H
MRRTQGSGGFTLIEMLAVITIFALVAAVVAPQVSVVTGRALKQRARDLAVNVQLARERAMLTGTPHRVLVDLESNGYRVEWYVTEAEALGETEAPGEAVPLDLSQNTPLPLQAPRGKGRDWRPLTGTLGRFVWLEDELAFDGVETAGEWIRQGDVGVEFEWDGTTAPAAIYLDDESGRSLVLDVLPLADGVRIQDAG